MRKRTITILVPVAALSAAAVGMASPSASAPTARVVRPGESIQRAVDAARPGDTVLVLPGTYRESVRITTSGLTLRGTGGRTVIRPAEPGTRAADDACAKAGNGVCVLGAAGGITDGVRVESLTVSGFKKSGVWSSRTDRLTVRRVTAEHNGVWGIAQERSTRALFTENAARSNGDAGIFVANTVDEEGGATDTGGTEVSHNALSDNRIGLTARRVRNLSVHHNGVTANCTGMFVVGDEGRPQAGAMTIESNTVTGNNKFCAATERLSALQGSGIVLTGAADTRVRANTVRDNAGTSPMSGGVVLFKSFVGTKNTNNTISDNVVLDNKPADLTNGDTGKGNTFTANTCATSAPAGMC
ncbi:right-handed parallel beta-helix repeat-containing protein [Streptomyces sp. NPDC001108]